jgi:hypothetical protein
MPDAASKQCIRDLFRKTPVMEMSDLERAAAPRSRRSLFRDLSALDYLSSYTHAGRYYTLRSMAVFDSDGIWRWQGVGFSRAGTLKSTVLHLVDSSQAGHTQRELQGRLGVRVHNPLLELVEDKKLGRESLDDEYVYVAAARVRGAAQLRERRSLVVLAPAAPTLRPTLEVEVLLEVIHGAQASLTDAAILAERLAARGVQASVAEVAAVLERHGLEKTPPSRSRRSSR